LPIYKDQALVRAPEGQVVLKDRCANRLWITVGKPVSLSACGARFELKPDFLLDVARRLIDVSAAARFHSPYLRKGGEALGKLVPSRATQAIL
jgi:hypothetical protein